MKNYEKIYIDGNQEFYLFSFKTKDVNRVIPLHFHQEIEVLYCISGKIKIWIGGETIVLTPNHFFVINSLVPHSTQSYESGEFVVFYFRPNLFLKSQAWIQISDERENQIAYQKAISLINEIYDSTYKKDMYIVFHQRSLLNEFIYVLLKYFSIINNLSQRVKTRNNKIKEIIQLMQDNYLSQLTLEELAKLSGYTATYLSRMFKENTGQTFSEYKRSLCIEHAINMIENSDYTLEMIANESGFTNEKALRIAFKEVMKMTPREYIRNIKR